MPAARFPSIPVMGKQMVRTWAGVAGVLLAMVLSVSVTPSAVGWSAPSGKSCAPDYEYSLRAKGITCTQAKRLVRIANRKGRAAYEGSRCERTNRNGGECTRFERTFKVGSFRCNYRTYPWDYLGRTACRHREAPKAKWVVERY